MASVMKSSLALLSAVLCFWCSGSVLAHDVAEHLDPELITGWRTWVHLTIQWTHLAAFALWLGLTFGVILLGIEAPLDHLLYPSWILFLISFATGTYNMEWSAGISETPSVFLLPLLERIPYAVTYTLALAAKLALFVAAILFTLAVTLLRLRRRANEQRQRKIFLTYGALLVVSITLTASVVLYYHEVADLWPTPLHSQGGVMGPDGPRGQPVTAPQEPPNDFSHLASGDAWIDIGLRWLHLLGFGLWLGGGAWALCFSGVSAARYLLLSWALVALQIVSGVASMARWTPFYVPPYIWNISELSAIRFARSYTLFMAAKHLLIAFALVFLTVWTVRYWKAGEMTQLTIRPLAAVNVLLALAVGYIMMIVLLLHEGVDHAL